MTIDQLYDHLLVAYEKILKTIYDKNKVDRDNVFGSVVYYYDTYNFSFSSNISEISLHITISKNNDYYMLMFLDFFGVGQDYKLFVLLVNCDNQQIYQNIIDKIMDFCRDLLTMQLLN